MTTLRLRIRAVTDALPKRAWTTMRATLTALGEPKPTNIVLGCLMKKMADAGELERRGTRRRLEYRSGAVPTVDGRLRLKGPRDRRAAGNVALARLQRTNPAEFERLTKNDGPGWRRGA